VVSNLKARPFNIENHPQFNSAQCKGSSLSNLVLESLMFIRVNFKFNENKRFPPLTYIPLCHIGFPAFVLKWLSTVSAVQ
jgi:hypothetical protein